MNTQLADYLNALSENTELNLERIQQAAQLVDTLASETAIAQGIDIANELIKLNCDSQTIAAGLFYPTFQQQPLKRDTLIKKLGGPIYKLLLGINRMEAIKEFTDVSPTASGMKQRADNLRKMLLAMVDDIRVVLIKLATQIAIMRAIKNADEHLRLKIAHQTLELYAPLANRLGVGQFKWLLEDLAFRYIKPDEYQKLSKALNMRREDREQFIADMIDKLNSLLNDEHIKPFEVSGRAKHIYSIHKKVTRKKVSFTEIYDTSAFRILVPTIKDCYSALSVIHATWEPIAVEFDDYIAKPKPNGYRSIHTAVVGPQNINIEIQIRTYKMHDEAELGVAAHWKYKEGRSEQSTYEDKISWLREVMDWQKELTHEEDESKLISEIFEDRIYVFTPNGDIFDLSSGATPVDFAYHVHTEVGHRCRGAKVNDQLVPLTHRLKTGDQVQILTSKESKPSRDWLNPDLGYLHTHHARQKVSVWFKKQLYEHHLAEGLAIFEKAQRKQSISKTKLQQAAKHFNYKRIDDLMVAIGSGHLGLAHLLNYIKQEDQPPADDTAEIPTISSSRLSKQATAGEFDIQGIGNLLSQLAKCCKPIPGDEAVGYITRGRGISIHQKNCPNILEAMRNNPERIMPIDWSQKKQQKYPVDLWLECENRTGLIRDISSLLANNTIPLLGINSKLDAKKNIAVVHLTIEIQSIEPLQKIINTLQQIPGISKVVRST